jgi:hypothetical protein
MRLRDIIESSTPELPSNIERTLPHAAIIPDLPNNDSYRQYRYVVALASAKAKENGEVDFDPNSTWNEALAVIAYTDAELEIIELANKMMGVSSEMISKSPSIEPDDTHIASPVMKFSMTESMRNTLDKLSDE